jgi:hypothetical protein
MLKIKRSYTSGSERIILRSRCHPGCVFQNPHVERLYRRRRHDWKIDKIEV